MPGPGRTPTAIRAAQGTLRADRVNAREPTGKPGVPTPSRGLELDVKREYDKLARDLAALNVATEDNVYAIELTAGAIAEYWHYRAILATGGATYTTTTKEGSEMVRPRPEVKLAQDAWRRALTGLIQFGLTPSARAKVSETGPPPPVDPIKQFQRARPAAPARLSRTPHA